MRVEDVWAAQVHPGRGHGNTFGDVSPGGPLRVCRVVLGLIKPRRPGHSGAKEIRVDVTEMHGAEPGWLKGATTVGHADVDHLEGIPLVTECSLVDIEDYMGKVIRAYLITQTLHTYKRIVLIHRASVPVRTIYF